MTETWDKLKLLKVHREAFPTHFRSYWKDNVASNKDEASICVIEARRMAHVVQLNFDWPSQKNQIETVEELLKLAFEAGERKAKADIRQLLGVKP